MIDRHREPRVQGAKGKNWILKNSKLKTHNSKL
jgi:hypothetical protein